MSMGIEGCTIPAPFKNERFLFGAAKPIWEPAFCTGGGSTNWPRGVNTVLLEVTRRGEMG
jgi:hypothetical protein